MKKSTMTAAVLFMAAAGFAAAPVLDANSDGKISKEEYIFFRSESARQSGQKLAKDALEKAFERTDTDKDGFLSAEERAAANKK